MSTWTVHKFGGSSLASAELYRRVGQILVDREDEQKGVVVSAMGGVTDRLLSLVAQAKDRDSGYRHEIQELREHVFGIIEELLPANRAEALESRLKDDFHDIEDILRALWLLGTSPGTASDLISGYGELWSAQLLAAHLAAQGESVDWLDAREVLTVQSGELGPVVDREASREALAEWLSSRDTEYVIITGFIASTPEGIPTTLGRNGSDFSASIFGAMLEADSIHIWTDVDGVMSANPRQVPDAVLLEKLSYQEAMEMAYFGAKVIHPSTMAPAVELEIPLYIRNTFNPDFPGTRIHLSGASEHMVKGFATVEDIALVNVEGSGMIGVPGIASRLFDSLREAGISVVMISQASSEHSICFAVPQAQARQVKDAVERGFFAELHQGRIQTVDINEDNCILAVVGDGMAGIPGVASEFFGALGKANVNIRAIAQGSSERNISAVIDQGEATRALRAVHAGFYLSKQTLSVGIIGPGNVGGTLLSQLGVQLERLREDRMIDIRVRALTTSDRMVLEESAIDPAEWELELAENGVEADLDALVDHVQTDYHPHAVIIDCTASHAVADHYADWLERGIHVVTPNKKGNTQSMEYYRRLKQAVRSKRRHYLYETTVGAGLPIIQTLRDLLETGDDIIEVEGILSGTLSYLFNSFDGERPFSEILVEAKEKGFTEPDPREDLSGMDVARKVVILAREMGLDLELDDVEVEGLVPDELSEGSIEDFLSALPDYDDEMTALLEDARETGEVLRFVGRVDAKGTASVKLRRYPETHAFARIHLTDNIVQFRTRRYDENPLVVQGPGAGPAVTAGGIFADLLRLATYVGATT
ncbi:MAG: bifunctional aspartate kinase/homoserine dehydrogenase I [Myxococcota bacterium]